VAHHRRRVRGRRERQRRGHEFGGGLPIYSPILTVALAVLAVVVTVVVPDNDRARIGEIAAGVVIALVAAIFILSPETVVGGG
jgi:hypothetical protein